MSSISKSELGHKNTYYTVRKLNKSHQKSTAENKIHSTVSIYTDWPILVFVLFPFLSHKISDFMYNSDNC